MTHREEIKALLQDRVYWVHWDNQSVDESQRHIETWWDKENETLEDFFDFDCNVFEDAESYLKWYFEDETPFDVIRHIIDSQSKQEFINSCLGDGSIQLNNGAYLRILI
ncbi:TPA: hypothetical protein ACN1V3_002670 [Staphylococcus aureus]